MLFRIPDPLQNMSLFSKQSNWDKINVMMDEAIISICKY